MNDIERSDLLETLEDRHHRQSTIVTSQLPVKNWHETIGNATLADAILDRLVHNAYIEKRKHAGQNGQEKQIISGHQSSLMVCYFSKKFFKK